MVFWPQLSGLNCFTENRSSSRKNYKIWVHYVKYSIAKSKYSLHKTHRTKVSAGYLHLLIEKFLNFIS